MVLKKYMEEVREAYRRVSITELQHRIGKEFKNLPFVVTNNKFDVAIVHPYSSLAEKTDARGILTEIVILGVERYRNNPGLISPKILMDAVKALNALEVEGDMNLAITEAGQEMFTEEKEEKEGEKKESEGEIKDAE